MPVAEALKILIGAYLKIIDESRELFLETSHESAIYRFRVTIRRIEAVFHAFYAILPRKEVQPLQRGLRFSARKAGKIRDIDVVITYLHQMRDNIPFPLREAFGVLLEAAQKERALYVERMRLYLQSEVYLNWRKAVEDFVHAYSPQVKAGLPYRVNHVLPSSLWQQVGHIRAFDNVVERMSAKDLHRFRRRCRELRYMIDIVRSAMGDEADVLIMHLAQVQEASGEVQDMRVIIKWLGQAVKEPVQAPIASYLLGLAHHQLERLLVKAPDWWQVVTSRAFREVLGKGTARL